MTSQLMSGSCNKIGYSATNTKRLLRLILGGLQPHCNAMYGMLSFCMQAALLCTGTAIHAEWKLDKTAGNF